MTDRFIPVEGGCQCGAVRYRINGKPVYLAICGCDACRMQSGAVFGMSLRVRRENFELLSGELKIWSRTADSGGQVDCAFCPECGNRIWHAPLRFFEFYHVKPGTLDERNKFRPAFMGDTHKFPDWLEIKGPKDVGPVSGK